MNKNKGVFISFEGGEAVGKTTQLKMLEKFLKRKKISYVLTREPGGTKISEKIRQIILNNKSKISNKEELLLFMTSRLNHINTVIKPALVKGQLILSDRFVDSTFVYQCFVNGFNLSKGMKLHKELLNNFLPTKTFLFFLSPKETLRRLRSRKSSNKYDKKDINFHKKVFQGYKKISKNNKRFILIDAEKSFNEIQVELQNNIIKLIK